jgi:DNA-binding MarR family transcriptional regulator
MKIEEEIKQTKFRDQYQKAAINIFFTASWMNSLNAEALKPFNISIQQFNILRILKGMYPEPVTVKLLTERMIDKMSNASRLVDKLNNKNLVERKSCPMDRRRVDVKITDFGLKTVNEASKALEVGINHKMKNITELEAGQLSDLLDRLRG